MPFPKGQNPNHPVAGSTIKVEPIRDKKAIARIKKILGDRPRDLCLFTLGINTNSSRLGYRWYKVAVGFKQQTWQAFTN